MTSGLHHDDGRTPAQWFCLAGGIALVLAGLAGFLADSTFDTGGNLNGDTLLGLEVNGWHNIVHLASGLLLLSGATLGKRDSLQARNKARSVAKTVALVFGGTYVLVTLIGLIDGEDIFELLPINDADNALHAALALAAIAAALASKAIVDRGRDHAHGEGGTVGRQTTPRP